MVTALRAGSVVPFPAVLRIAYGMSGTDLGGFCYQIAEMRVDTHDDPGTAYMRLCAPP